MAILPPSDFDKISPTALLVAYIRQFSNLPYTQEIATLSDAVATVDLFVEPEKYPVMMAAVVESRYRAIESIRERFGHTQILELASGLLPRGAIRSQNPDITFVESDLPGIIHQKQQLIQQLIGNRSNLHFQAIDATNPLDFLGLTEYFQPDRQVTILCEGLLVYLTFAEKQRVFENVRSILQTYDGVWISSDFATKAMGQMRRSDPTIRDIFQKIERSMSRTLAENEFDDLDHAKRFAQEQGFQVESLNMSDVFDQLQCLSRLELDPHRVRAMLATNHVFALTLA